MHSRVRTATFFLVVLALVAVLLAGCGGGGGGQEDQQGNGKVEGGGGQGGGGVQGKEGAQDGKVAPVTKIALGTVKRVNYGNRRVFLRPTKGEGLMIFKVMPDAKITLDGKEAELEDVKEGQNAQIEYIAKNERNRARSMTLFAAGETG